MAKQMFNSASLVCFFNSAAGSSSSLGAQRGMLGMGGERKSSSTSSQCEWEHACPTCPYSNEAVLGLRDVWFQAGMVQLHSHRGSGGLS